MHKFRWFIAAAAALAFVPRADAAPIGSPDGLRAAIEHIAVTEQAQYVWRGRRYCWYFNGWRGPGWYRCGYSWRRGQGWGGGHGWHGWRGGHPHRFDRRDGFRRDFRRGDGDRRDGRRGRN